MAIKFEEDDTTAAAESAASGSKSKNGEDSNKENIDLVTGRSKRTVVLAEQTRVCLCIY
jgi:hypothetical protein